MRYETINFLSIHYELNNLNHARLGGNFEIIH